jgi:hypothetical protein
MNFTKLVPSVFYVDLSDGLKLFVDCLQFKVVHQDLKTSQPYCFKQERDWHYDFPRRAISERASPRT